MRIGIDCRLSGIAHAGIGRYIENLITRLPQVAPEIEWVYFFHDQDQIPHGLKVETQLVPIRHYSLNEQLKLPQFFQKANLDLLHVPHFNVPIMYSGKLVVTIHDLLWHQQKGPRVTTLKPWQYWIKYLGYRFVASQAVKKADQIIVPAQTIKKTLSDYYPDAANKIAVTYEGVDDRLSQFNDLKIQRKKNSLIYVGSLYPHKNVGLVIKALQKLPNWQLQIVGARNIFQDQTKELVNKYGVEKQVEFAGFLSDADLAKEIKTATALVQPSLSEGFGLTGIEAMSLNTPVLASDIPIFREIYQDGATYFDPHSVDSFVRSLSGIKTNKEIMKKVVKQYSWDEMVKKTVEAYKSVS